MLFRREVSQHLQARHEGQVLLVTGWPLWMTLCATGILMTALVLFLLFGSFTRRVTVSGEVTTWPHTVNLFAPEQGVVSRLLVTTGQVVTPGTPLYRLDTSRVSPDGNLSDTTRALLRGQLQQADEVIAQLLKNKKATLDGLTEQLAQTQQALQTSDAMVASATEGMGVMRRNMENYDRFLKRGLVTADQQNNQRYLYYQQQSVWHSLNSQRLQQNQQLLSIRSDRVTKAADFDSQIAQYRIRREDTARQLAEATAGGLRVITAPSAGRISSLSVTEGQMVNSGDSLVQLVPAVNPVMRLVLWLPGDSIPFVHPGDPVNIRYAAYPSDKYGQFPGTVDSVSSAPVTPGELATQASAPRQQNGQPAEGWFKAVIRLHPEGMRYQGRMLPLTAGMQAQATLFLENRPLWQWMFTPFSSLKNSLSGPVHDKK